MIRDLVTATLLLSVSSLACDSTGSQSHTLVAKVQTPSQERSRVQAQRIFGAEDEVANPVAVPDEVLQLLKSSELLRTRLGNTPIGQVNPDWFVASEFDLDEDGIRDFVILPKHPRLGGANVIPFWVVCGAPGRYRLALSIVGLGFEILSTKTKGFHDIRISSASGTTLTETTLKFNGKKYAPYRAVNKPI